MATVTVRPFGAWASPISADLIATASLTLAEVAFEAGALYWVEGRPWEGGRMVVMRRHADIPTELTPAPYSARNTVHESGGGALLVSGGIVYFTNFADQAIYRIDRAGRIEPVTATVQTRFADAVLDVRRRRLLAIAEEHGAQGTEAVNRIVTVSLAGPPEVTPLVTGADFYAAPRLSPDGSSCAWLSWNHPNMPWDGTELWVASLGPDGAITERTRVAGGSEESIVQPEWSPDGTLHFVSDRTGWWNLYRRRHNVTEAVAPLDADFGRPQWTFGNPTYAFLGDDRLVVSFTRGGRWTLALVDPTRPGPVALDTPYTEIEHVRASGNSVSFVGGSPREPRSLVRLDLGTRELETVVRSSTLSMDEGYLSTPEAVEFPTTGRRTAHGLFYPPVNRDFAGPRGERPPLLVVCHGGPTSAAATALDVRLQFWTSRGFAVLDVNYGGSTGYGRAYRRRLEGQWGVVDVDDCVNGARAMVAAGRADGRRLVIRGGSAGGYTTLCALTFRDLFCAGASYFGVSDLAALARDTHKFESRYLDRLVGPYPQQEALYHERSPLPFADRCARPVIFFQGLEDKVVPPNQTERMVEALRTRGVPVAYLPFEHEPHGFRKAETIKRTLEAELFFYGAILGFTPADPIEPIVIDNL